MRVIPTIILLILCRVYLLAQVSPLKDYPKLFHEVQLSGIFHDSKTFCDYAPIISGKKVDSTYLAEMKMPGFLLEDFIKTYFVPPVEYNSDYTTDTSYTVEEHIEQMWSILSRPAHEAEGSLIALKHPYIVPGGRFREIYYWDSYFTMLGLARSGEYDKIENMVRNFADLIDQFGFIPNGNRTYYLSRSQPPFFALMVDLLRQAKGDEYVVEFLPQLEAEYNFWMSGSDLLSENKTSCKHVVLLPNGDILNRYWDKEITPRPEAYSEDIEMAKLSDKPDSICYRNIRSACESGWDFSSRWFADGESLATIQTTQILPVDLNCLLFVLERTLSELYDLKHDKKMSRHFDHLAHKREKAIDRYFWNKDHEFYSDYNFITESQNRPDYLSGMFPLFVNIASKKQASNSAEYLEANFLKAGGLATSLHETEQQWDAPNGWAPLQYISIKGLENYEHNSLADSIAERWLNTNNKVFKETGKLVEKYNVVDLSVEGGGGEYPNQDGFGWTNGVYLKLLVESAKEFKNKDE